MTVQKKVNSLHLTWILTELESLEPMQVLFGSKKVLHRTPPRVSFTPQVMPHVCITWIFISSQHFISYFQPYVGHLVMNIDKYLMYFI